ncbi:MAG: hypothetical protein LBU65_00625 [Planctomycetaceae bacterium]|nr:hypothetical protein [Planctomycetaceae bacterium]
MKNNIKKSTLMKTFDAAKKAVLPFVMATAMVTPAEVSFPFWRFNAPTYSNSISSTDLLQMQKNEMIAMQEVFNRYDPELFDNDGKKKTYKR